MKEIQAISETAYNNAVRELNYKGGVSDTLVEIKKIHQIAKDFQSIGRVLKDDLYSTLAEVTELVIKNKSDFVKSVNAHEVTSDWIRDKFFIPYKKNHFPKLWGVPIKSVDYLIPGFIEVEYKTGERNIVNIGNCKITVVS